VANNQKKYRRVKVVIVVEQMPLIFNFDHFAPIEAKVQVFYFVYFQYTG
jgi:hypothetical protein